MEMHDGDWNPYHFGKDTFFPWRELDEEVFTTLKFAQNLQEVVGQPFVSTNTERTQIKSASRGK